MEKFAKRLANAIKKFWQAFCKVVHSVLQFTDNIIKRSGVIILVTSMVIRVVAYVLETVPEVQMLNEITQVLFGIYILVWIVMNVDSTTARVLEVV